MAEIKGTIQDRLAGEQAKINSICNFPKQTAVKPVKVAPNVFYAGNEWVGVYWISTSEGLILFDCGMPSQKDIIFDSIREMGFEPKDIKLILISHAHYDHCGGLNEIAQYTKADVYISKKDESAVLSGIGLLAFENPYTPYVGKIKYYEDVEQIKLGEVTVSPVVTGGHTIGCTCFFFSVSDGERNYSVGIHGGLGFARFYDENFANASEAIRARDSYREAQAMIINRKIDIPLSFHTYNLNSLEKVNLAGGYKNLFEPDAWGQMINERLRSFAEFEKTSIYQKEN